MKEQTTGVKAEAEASLGPNEQSQSPDVREAVARIVDPKAWELIDKAAANPVMPPEDKEDCHEILSAMSYAAADAILSLPPLNHGGDEGRLPASPSAPVPANTASPAWTPGPWATLSPQADSERRLISSNCNPDGSETGTHKNGGMMLAWCFGPDRDANARLIAAAPDLYAALDELLPADWRDGVMDHVPGVAAARAALRKACGEQA